MKKKKTLKSKKTKLWNLEMQNHVEVVRLCFVWVPFSPSKKMKKDGMGSLEG